MKKYIKPTASVINVAVRESLSARNYRVRQYTVNGKSKEINTAIYTSDNASKIDFKSQVG